MNLNIKYNTKHFKRFPKDMNIRVKAVNKVSNEKNFCR